MTTIADVYIENMETRSGRGAANRFYIEVGDKKYLQSYTTLVASCVDGRYTLDPDWCCSRTTMYYIKQFTGMDTKTLRKCIEDGTIEVRNLN